MDLDVVATGKDGEPVTDLGEGRDHGHRGRHPVRARLFRPHRRRAGPRPGPRERVARRRPRDDARRRHALGPPPVPRLLRRRAPDAVREEARHRGAARLRHAPLAVRLDGAPRVQHLDPRLRALHELEGGSPRRPLDGSRSCPRAGCYWDTQYRQAIRDARRYSPFSIQGQSRARLHRAELGRAGVGARQGHARRVPPDRRRARGALGQARSPLRVARHGAAPGPEPRAGPRRDRPEPVRLRRPAPVPGRPRVREPRRDHAPRDRRARARGGRRRLRVRSARDRPVPREREPARDPRGLRGRDGRASSSRTGTSSRRRSTASTANPRATTPSASPSRPSTRRSPRTT